MFEKFLELLNEKLKIIDKCVFVLKNCKAYITFKIIYECRQVI